MAKLPSFQFYPGDWMKDPELRLCSMFARGLLVDLLCIMFEAKHRGRLVLADNETPWTDEQVVDAVTGGDRQEKISALSELLLHGVLSRDEQGIIYSKRLVRDEQVRLERSKAGISAHIALVQADKAMMSRGAQCAMTTVTTSRCCPMGQLAAHTADTDGLADGSAPNANLSWIMMVRCLWAVAAVSWAQSLLVTGNSRRQR